MNRALLVTRPDRDTIEEADALARAAGYEPVGVVTQGFLHHAKYGVGTGKAEELAREVKEKEADLIIFDSALRASQTYALAKLCKVEVKDREKVILEIFAMRASTAEAKLQVQLAELEYEIPRARENVRMARQAEQPGFFGLGKYEADVYTRMMKSRVSTLKRKVEAVAKRREIFRENRRKLAFPTIALAGYTAAGKTSLFNFLTGESKSVDAGVFTTLAPTTRAMMVGERKTLLTDTVGFISNLPAYLIESFKSTLEEISYASVVFLLLDVSQSAEKFIRSFESSAEVHDGARGEALERDIHPEQVRPRACGAHRGEEAAARPGADCGDIGEDGRGHREPPQARRLAARPDGRGGGDRGEGAHLSWALPASGS